jgi:hypothetical protein
VFRSWGVEAPLAPTIDRPIHPPIERAGGSNRSCKDGRPADCAGAKHPNGIDEPDHEEMGSIDWIRELPEVPIEQPVLGRSEQEGK